MFHPRNILLAALSLGLTAPLAAQRSAREWERDCDDYGDWGERFCEVREYTLKGSGSLRVDANPNGGITVIGWDKNEVKVVARVSTWARTEEEAKDIATQVKVETSDAEIHTTGPNMRNRRGWSVSYEIWAPAKTDLRLSSTNGGLDVEGIRGRLDLETTNGGISLQAVSGDVNAETTNGGITVDLAGRRWDGVGLNARTTNGGVKLYGARRIQRRSRSLHHQRRDGLRIPGDDPGPAQQADHHQAGRGRAADPAWRRRMVA